jgi:hypothetical protein
MTTINGVGTGSPVTWRAGGPATGSGFSLQAGAASAAAGLTAAASVATPGMLALQEAETDAARDRRARRHGQAVLDELANMQRALLAGGADPAMLRRLAALVRALPEAADPHLQVILRAVALRATVELTRLEFGGR